MLSCQLQANFPVTQPRLHTVWVPLPKPAASEVQVRVIAASVNPIDVKRATGYGRRLLALKNAGTFPLTLGNDFVGEVEAVGAQVRQLAVGDRVIGLRPTGGRGGTHASRLNISAAQARRLPEGCDPVASCTLPYSYTTMRLALASAGISAGRARGLRVLLHGASGALGQLALRTLHSWGAEVAAVCRDADARICRGLGAHNIIDRTQAGWRELGATFDATLNFARWEDEHWLLQQLKPGALGHATTVHPLLGQIDHLGWLRGAWQVWNDFQTHRAVAKKAGGPGCRYGWTLFRPDAQFLDELVAALEAAPFSLPVGVQVPLAQGQQAFDHLFNGGAGRAVLTGDAAAASERHPPDKSFSRAAE